MNIFFIIYVCLKNINQISLYKTEHSKREEYWETEGVSAIAVTKFRCTH